MKAHTTETNLLAAAAAATCGQGSDCQNNAHSVKIILDVVKNYTSLQKRFFRLLRQVLSCYNPAMTRARSGERTKVSKRPHIMLQRRTMKVLTKMLKSRDSSKKGGNCPKKKKPIEGAEQKNKKLHQRKEEGEKTS